MNDETPPPVSTSTPASNSKEMLASNVSSPPSGANLNTVSIQTLLRMSQQINYETKYRFIIFYLGTDTNGVGIILYACLVKVPCQKSVKSQTKSVGHHKIYAPDL